MMTPEQREIVKMVYERFITSEEDRWSRIDDLLEELSWLSHEELIGEVVVRYISHCQGNLRCSQKHEKGRESLCFAPYVLESVEIILKLFDETEDLHPKNAYLLSYYLAMSEMKMIFSEV